MKFNYFLEPRHYLLAILFVVVGQLSFAQTAIIIGKVTDVRGDALPQGTVVAMGKALGTFTDQNGRFKLEIPSNEDVRVSFTYVGFDTTSKIFNLQPGEKVTENVQLQTGSQELNTFTFEAEGQRTKPMTKINSKVVSKIPGTGGFERVLLSQGLGVTSNNELSSSYSVRGGNFDENLIYVNGVQVYRPFLVRSGQQEGLSFINSDMVSNVKFSSGGFEAKYGDAMSSVLDIEYKEPKRFEGSITASLLGANLYIGNSSKNYRFTQIHGLRYRTNQYLLGSLDTEGQYRPRFFDYQTYLTYDLGPDLELGFLGHISNNSYQFIPETRETEFGFINQALRLTVFFDGNEVNQFETYTGAFNLDWTPRNKLKMKFIASAFRTLESETFDIQGAYRLSELERDINSEDFGDEAFTLGTGGFINHGRNYLDANVFSIAHRGTLFLDKGQVDWGAKWQLEDIADELDEWEVIDSVGFSIPYNPSDNIELFEVIKAQNRVLSNRVTGYAQYSQDWTLDSSTVTFNAGVRANHWNFNGQTTVSPRANLSWKPNWKRDVLFKAAWGYYHQHAFYREMRNLFGEINQDIRAQTAIHYTLGLDYNLLIWNRPFKFVTEAYYKQLKNLIPYEIDNVRIRYYANNNAEGYATGVDFKLNGEFIRGIESWISASIMQTQEDILDDKIVRYFNNENEQIIFGFTRNDSIVDSTVTNPGFIPRPTDQRVNFNVFFQDEIPRLPDCKMQLSMLFGSGLPFGPPTYNRFEDTLRIPPYRRVDIGFSYILLKGKEKRKAKNLKNNLKHFESLWIGVEVFNLLAINNTISYLWVRDVNNRQYGVPNFLTNRQLNAKMILRF